MSDESTTPPQGYGNIYTPHAGSMLIQVQREGHLAHRTIVLSPRKVRLLRLVASRRGLLVVAALLASWAFFALQAARVPILTRRIAAMEHDAARLDTLQLALMQLQQRYDQVQRMLGVRVAGTDSTGATIPDRWPLAETRYVTRGLEAAGTYADAHPGIDFAVPEGTEVRAAGAGVVLAVATDDEYGLHVRVRHAQGYETLYAHLAEALVRPGVFVTPGERIARSGNSGRSTAPHLHFELRRDGRPADPTQIITR